MFHPDVLGVIVGIIGIILGFIFYRRSKESVKPCFASFSEVLIAASEQVRSSGIEITFGDRVIANAYRSVVYFWNGGNKTLDYDDIATADPIVLHFEGPETEILKVSPAKSTRSVLKAEAVQDENTIALAFDFLDRGDGLIVETFYVGTRTNVRISGTIKGRQDIRQRATTLLSNDFPTLGLMPSRSTRNMLVTSMLVLIVGIILTVRGIYHVHHHWMLAMLPLASGIVFLAAAICGLLSSGFFYNNERIPAGLRKYN